MLRVRVIGAVEIGVISPKMRIGIETEVAVILTVWLLYDDTVPLVAIGIVKAVFWSTGIVTSKS